MHDSLLTNDVFSTVRQVMRLYRAEFCGRQCEQRRWNITDQKRSAFKFKNYLKVTQSAQFDPVSKLGFFYVTRSSAYLVCKRVCSQIVHLSLLLICVFKQSLATNGYYMDILRCQEQSSSVFRRCTANGSNQENLWEY